MSLKKVNRASTSSVNSPSHGGINGPRPAQDQNEPRSTGTSTGSKFSGYPQGHISRASGLNPRGANTNQSTHHIPTSISHLVPPQREDGSGVPGWAEKSEPNFLDLALEESCEDSDDDWEEVTCTANNAVVDKPPVADLRPETELAKGLTDVNTPIPGPSRQPRSRAPDVANPLPSTQPSVHKIWKRANPPRVSPAAEDPPTHKPTVSFKEKATELARSTGRLLAPSKPLPPRNLPVLSPSLTTAGPSSVPENPPHRSAQATSDSSDSAPQLFTSRGFSHHVQNLRERQTEDTLRRFHQRYGGVIVEHARRDLTDLMSAFAPAQSLDVSRGPRPAGRRREQPRTEGGKRMSKAQAQAEEVMKICRSAKSYIVDVAAIKRREVPTPQEPRRPAPPNLPPACSPSVQSEKMAPVVAGQPASRTRPPVSPPVSRPLPASLGSVPRGLKFTRNQQSASEPGEIRGETVGRVASSEGDVRGSRLASSSRDTRPPLTTDAPKRRREDLGREIEGTSRKKPRLGRP